MVGKVRTEVTAQQRKAIAMIVSKDVTGMTNAEIAEKLEIDESTLYRWRNNKAYNDELTKQAEEIQRHFLAEGYNILRGLLTGKTKESTKLKALELLFRNQGRMKDVREDTVIHKEADVDKLLDELQDM